MFVVLNVTAVPDHLRGYISRFLPEVSVGIFVGNVSARVRDNLWDRCTQAAATVGSATLIASERKNEQGFTVRTCGQQSREIVDMDGMLLATLPDVENADADGVAPGSYRIFEAVTRAGFSPESFCENSDFGAEIR